MQRSPDDIRQAISVRRISPGTRRARDDVMPPIPGRGAPRQSQKTPALRRFMARAAEFHYRQTKAAEQAFRCVHDEFPATFRLPPSP